MIILLLFSKFSSEFSTIFTNFLVIIFRTPTWLKSHSRTLVYNDPALFGLNGLSCSRRPNYLASALEELIVKVRVTFAMDRI